MLTRVFSPACRSQAYRGEVTRCNLRQPTWTCTPRRGGNPVRSLTARTRTLLRFALLCFALLRPALLCTNGWGAARRIRLSCAHGRMRPDKREPSVTKKPRSVVDDGRRGTGGNLRAICARHLERANARVTRPRRKGQRDQTCVCDAASMCSTCSLH